MKANKKVILVCGVIGSGKDYYAQQYIIDNPDERVGIYKLSNKLKDLVELEFGKIDDYEAFKLKNREWLQNKADEMKKIYGDTYFAKECFRSIRFDDYDTIIITDFRFFYELKFFNEASELFRDFDVYWTLCDYHSERYYDKNTHNSEKMAQFIKNNKNLLLDYEEDNGLYDTNTLETLLFRLQQRELNSSWYANLKF